MAEDSFLWDTNLGTGHGSATYSRTDWQKIALVFAAVHGDRGVGQELLNELQGTATAANTVQINTGGALVDGKPYYNDAVVNINIPSAVGAGNTRIDVIALRANWTAQTVLLTRIAGTDAASPSAPVLTQNSGTTWDLPLYNVLVNTSGTLTLTDRREFSNVIAKRIGGSATSWAVGGTTVYSVPNPLIQMGALIIAEGADDEVTIFFPEQYAAPPVILKSAMDEFVGAQIQLRNVLSDRVIFKLTGSFGFGAYTGMWLAIGPRR